MVKPLCRTNNAGVTDIINFSRLLQRPRLNMSGGIAETLGIDFGAGGSKLFGLK